METQESKCDVLIVGAGPAGLMLATWMAHCGIKARIVDKRSTKIFSGQADGLQMRSLEIFDSFGFADRAWKEANHLIEFCMWNPDENGKIRRSDRVPDNIAGISQFHEIVLHQGRIERFFLDNIKKYSKDSIRVERAVLPETLQIADDLCDDHSSNTYPITLKLRHLTDEEATPAQSNGSTVQDGLFRSNMAEDDTEDLLQRSREKQGSTEIVRAKYVVGCDGAHSWTRRQLGYQLEGEPTDYIWGVLDIIPITDFPDIRVRCAVHSATSGSLMVIPREKGLVRLYIQLLSIKPDVNSGRADRSQITPSSILAAAQKILAPYTLTYKYCDWWTAYQIGQRLGTDFHHRNRVFLAGDAVHTHSPKAGQGMNVSMQDSYNLGWKIGLVVKGIAKPEILATYEDERRKIAKDLIDFDHKFSRLFSGRPAKDVLDETGVSMQEFKEVFLKGNLFASGVAVEYDNSMLVAKKGRKDDEIYNDNAIATSPAKNITLGARLSPTKILNQASALPTPILTLLKSDSRFRILIFAGNIISPLQSHRLYGFCHKLTESTFMAPYLHSAVAVLTCHSAERTDVELLRDFPDVCRPFSEDMGFEYNSVFVDGGEVERQGGTGGVDTFSPSGTPSRAHGTAYEKYGIDRETGCIVITRPDQYVGYVGVLDGEEGWREVEGYFRGVLVDRERSSRREDYEIRGGDDDRSYDDEDDVSDDDGMMSDDDKIINSDDDQRIGEDDDGTTDIRVAAGSSRRW